MIPFDGRASIGAPQLLSRNDLISVIVRLQFDGWRVALSGDPGLVASKDEPYMNGRLFRGMVAVRNRLRLTNIYLVETPGIRVHSTPARPEAEPDIILLIAEFGANEPHAVIECKRLDPFENPRNLRGEYVRSGMDRFIEGVYGVGHNLDFMVAFVLRGYGASAISDVNDYLDNVGRTSDRLRKSSWLGAAGFVGESDHRRKSDGSRFRLLHSCMVFPRRRRSRTGR
jgi:hypothetical protein